MTLSTAQTPATSHPQIWAALEALTDPEIPVVTLRELGILREIRDGIDGLEVVITPTYSGCPAMGQIEDDVRSTLSALGIDARVVTQLAPAWTTDWMSEVAKDKLRAYGIAPPQCGSHGHAGEMSSVVRFSARPLRPRSCPAPSAARRTPPRPRTSAPPPARPCTGAWTAWNRSTTSNPISRAQRELTMSVAPRFHDLTVSRVSPEAAGSVAITLAIPDTLRDTFAFQPGQFLTLRASINGADVRRSYSICSTRSDLGRRHELDIGIRPMEGGVFSNWAAKELKDGDTLAVMPPDGRFVSSRPRALHRVGFAAGSGITPILSIMASTLEEQPESKFTLVYGNRRMASVMFNEALQDLKDRYSDRLTLIHVLSREAQESDLLQGRIDGDKVRAIIDALLPVGSMDEVFVCGPEAMIEATEAALLAAGVPANRIHSERFTSPTLEALTRCRSPGRADQSRSAVRWRRFTDRGAGRQVARTAHGHRPACARCGAGRWTRPAVVMPGRCVLHLPRQGPGRQRADGQELHT